MKRKLIIRYVLLSLPFLMGSILYSLGIFNMVSSMLFFVGGYVVIKNVCDYRIIKKNIRKGMDTDKKRELMIMDTDKIVSNEKNISKDVSIFKNNKYRSYEDIPFLRRTRRYTRVRRKY